MFYSVSRAQPIDVSDVISSIPWIGTYRVQRDASQLRPEGWKNFPSDFADVTMAGPAIYCVPSKTEGGDQNQFYSMPEFWNGELGFTIDRANNTIYAFGREQREKPGHHVVKLVNLYYSLTPARYKDWTFTSKSFDQNSSTATILLEKNTGQDGGKIVAEIKFTKENIREVNIEYLTKVKEGLESTARIKWQLKALETRSLPSLLSITMGQRFTVEDYRLPVPFRYSVIDKIPPLEMLRVLQEDSDAALMYEKSVLSSK